MTEKNVTQRLVIIGIVIVFAAFLLRDPRQTLRPGLDIAGGTSLIFELDTTGAGNDPTLAERVKEHLQRRVDPKGVFDLAWRVHGHNRIEVQMPLPPRDAKERLEAYRNAVNNLFEPDPAEDGTVPIHEITRGRIERVVRMEGDERAEAIRVLAERNTPRALQSLSGPDAEAQRLACEEAVADREARLMVAAERYDAMVAAREAYENALARARGELVAPPPETPGSSREPGESAAQPLSESERGDQAAADATAEMDPNTSTQPTSQEAASPAEPEEPPIGATEFDTTRREDAYFSAVEEYEDAVEQVLETNLSRRRFQEILDLEEDSAVRRDGLRAIREAHPDLRAEIDAVLAAHATWREGRRFLDGPGDLKRLLRGSGRLEFRILAEPSPDNPTKYDRYRSQLAKEGVKRRPEDEFGWFKIDNAMQFFNLDTQAELEDLKSRYKDRPREVVEMLGEDFYVLAHQSAEYGLLDDQPGQRPWKLTRAFVDRDQQGRYCVRFRLDVVGGNLFGRLTGDNIERPLCILVDDIAYSAPTVQSRITREGEITGEFSLEKVTYLVRTMEGGTLPARLKDTPLSERTIGSSLGESNRDKAVRAGTIAAIAVAAVMLIYYQIVCGSIANVALILNVGLILAAMAMLNARITLVGIAGIILSVGMAVDANVLIFERMREERERGTSLRLIINNGYDKALSTIFDSNITTLLTCLIIYYVGSEEVKGFGLTLGWGIVLNLFTSVFVTRTLFAVLLKYNLIKDIRMLRIIGVPRINWYAKRKFFLPVSLVLIVLGLFLLFERGRNNYLDVEFLGGVAAEFELKEANMDDVDIQRALASVGERIAEDGARLAEATVEPIEDQPGAFSLRVPNVTPLRVAAMVAEPLEDANLLERGGMVADPDHDAVTLYTQAEVTQEMLLARIREQSGPTVNAGKNLGGASINAILDVEGVEQQGLVWNMTTTVTNMRLVEHALLAALGNNLRIEPSVSYSMRGRDGQPYPITDRLLEAVVPGLPPGTTADLTDYLGGAAIYLDELEPPVSTAAVSSRVENMRFQPDFQDLPMRPFEVIGVRRHEGAGDDVGNPLYDSIVIATADQEIRYSDNPDQWYSGLVAPQMRLVDSALSSEQTLRKVMQFKPQIAERSTRQASIALLLSWGMIIGYLWIRFGRPMYGVAGVAALVHDVLIALAFVGISGWLGGKDHPIGNFLLISDFKINMTIVAALLTIIGYSINDTIVVFDRIRETRGRLGVVTPEVINDSINQTLARTIMTSFTTLVVLTIMYALGGGSIRGFNFAMIIGILTGSYSSIAIAAPLLMARMFGPKPAPARAG